MDSVTVDALGVERLVAHDGCPADVHGLVTALATDVGMGLTQLEAAVAIVVVVAAAVV